MKNLIKSLSLLLTFSILLTSVSCHNSLNGSGNIIRIKGSYTMYELTTELAAEYMVGHPGISIYVEGGGTTTGFKGLEEGTIDIAMASRLIRSEEASSFASRYGKIGISFLVAKDALSIYINPENPVNSLSFTQLKSIFTGEYDNWNQIGGSDASIQVVLRPPTSGTYVYFKDFVLENAEYANKAITIPTNTALFEYIKQTPYAIGFAGIFSPNTVKKCMVEHISPDESNVSNDTYPLIRYLYLYTIDEPTGIKKQFIDWVLSKKGQTIVKKVGFFPLWL